MSRSSDWILTSTGQKFRPLTPKAWQINPEDIGHALSLQCRFTGHTRTFYSVAQHCLNAALIAKGQGWSKKTQFFTLMHDATEAYLCDIASPLKRQPAFDAYRKAESNLWAAMCARWGLPLVLPRYIKEIDGRLCTTEALELMPTMPLAWHRVVPPPYTRAELNRCGVTTEHFRPVPPEIVETNFRNAFRELWRP